MTEAKNLYGILGIPRDASKEDIRLAYRKLALENHPDKNYGSEESTRRFVEIGGAYEVLSDTGKRDQYDRLGYAGNRRHQQVNEDFNATLHKYKSQFYAENWDIFLNQIDDSTKILYAGFDPELDISTNRMHSSKSKALPILKGEKGGSNVIVTSIGHNFYNYFLGIELREPIAATLMYPISGLFGRYALSGHTDPDGAPPITNFQRDYHNRKPIERFGVECSSPLRAALTIRYLNEVSKLPAQDIFDIVLDNTHYGKLDGIDWNAVGGDGDAALANILGLGFEKVAYYDFDVTNAPSIFNKMNLDWHAVHIEFADLPIPSMPIPWEAVLIPTTKEQQALGIRNKVPAHYLEYKKDHGEERMQMSEGCLVSDHYHNAEWGNMNWTIKTPNGLDAGMTAFFLNHVLEPTLRYFAPDRLMLNDAPSESSGKTLEQKVEPLKK